MLRDDVFLLPGRAQIALLEVKITFAEVFKALLEVEIQVLLAQGPSQGGVPCGTQWRGGAQHGGTAASKEEVA